MYIKRTGIVIILNILVSTNYCMEQQNKEAIEEEHARYLKEYGNEDVPQEIQDLNEKVMFLYKKKGFLKPNTRILVKYMNPATIESLRKAGCSTWNNSLTNGAIIHIGAQHCELTPEEIESRLAHEQAHIVLEQNAYLNPHYYLNNLHLWGLIIGIPASCFSVGPLTVTWSKKPTRTLTCLGLVLGVCFAGNTYLNGHAEEHYDLPLRSPNRLQYRCLKKIVEIECDIIAARILPHGGKAGRKLYTKSLLHNGDRNGIDGDHPFTSTRIWYHSKIEQLQNYFDKKEEPDIKQN